MPDSLLFASAVAVVCCFCCCCNPTQALTLKAVSKDTWPAVQWTSDDALMFNAVTNNVHVYSKADNYQVYVTSCSGLGCYYCCRC